MNPRPQEVLSTGENTNPPMIRVGDLVALFLEHCGVKATFGVISIHNMPILDGIHQRNKLRFVSARGEAGACNMADAYARSTGGLGVCITSTGTGAGNAAGALIEAQTAGTPLLHLTGQIETEYLDRDLGVIHEAPKQLAMLEAAGKAAFRIHDASTALATLEQAVALAFTAPCGPVSVEIPIDVQAALVPWPSGLLEQAAPSHVCSAKLDVSAIEKLTDALATKRRPLLWVGGGARQASAAVARLAALGFGVVSSVQGRGILPEDHPMSLAAYHLQGPAEALYQQADAMLVVGSRLRSNETLKYQLLLPKALYRIDANALADNRAYANSLFVNGDASQCLHALADRLEEKKALEQFTVDSTWQEQIQAARRACELAVDNTLGPYVALKTAVSHTIGSAHWVRDITLSNTMWGNRCPVLRKARLGIHALGGGIGQALAMSIGCAVANTEHGTDRKVFTLVGDGGFMLNLGELACAVQEKAAMIVLLMNDKSYGVIRNIQDAAFGGRHCYVDLHTPDFEPLCNSMGVSYVKSLGPADIDACLQQATSFVAQQSSPAVIEIDMASWGPFAAKFAGPPTKKH